MHLATQRSVILFEEISMPEKKTLEAAQEDKREGKAPTTQAGEFVREEIHHVREGKHGARNPKQAIAIGLSKARRAGVRLPAPTKGQSAETRKKAARDMAKGKEGVKPSLKRSRARVAALKREGRGAASHSALSTQTKSAAKKRGAAARSAAGRKAVKTKGPMARKVAARKAARTRARRGR
jgi:Family of unknown function (DUF6496)